MMKKILLSLCALLPVSSFAEDQAKPPNIICFLVDDLGYGEVGVYGQKKIRTPHIDKLAHDGIKFTQFYSGQNVCAPTRCALLTGKHMGNAAIRENSSHLRGKMPQFKVYQKQDGFPGQAPLPAEEVTVAEVLKEKGYSTACIGKWGLGYPLDEGSPLKQGFDFFYGYICQVQAHNYYPRYLWKNDSKVDLPGNDRGLTGQTYAADVMREEALNYIKQNKDNPFFLYYATPIPHAALQVPEDEPSLAEYREAFGPEKPYVKGAGYLPNKTPRATYAAMVTRMDRTLGMMRTLLEDLDIDDNTLILFASDNGATFNGGYDRAFFNGNGPLRGKKCDLYEGGIRVPAIAAWPGKIQPNQTTSNITAIWDFLATVCDMTGATLPENTNGISFLPTLLGKEQPQHKYLYWESRLTKGQQVVRMGKWKGIRNNVMKSGSSTPLALYNLDSDIGEKKNLAKQFPEVVEELERYMRSARTPNPLFPMGALEKEYE
ncbi:arylsulfatase [Rubritalea tangerina]|uniref:Arylsulfatase n=1 Tax=Rubritalea tangerina TaxID=430798 RepID=A0ABW4Z792_9BACT